MLSTNLVGGGAEAQAVNLAVGLKSRGWHVSAASLVKAPYPVQLREAGIVMQSLNMPLGWPDCRVIPTLISGLRRERPHIIHSHLVHANLLARFIRRLLPVRALICTLHNINMSGIHHDYGRIFEVMHRWSDSLADITTAICQCAADQALSAKVVPPQKMRVMPNGVNLTTFRPDEQVRKQARHRLGVDKKFVWLAAGRLEVQKDYENMLRAFAILSKADRERATLLISGTGSLERQLIRLSKELHIAGEVRFLGSRSDMPDLLNAADAFVMSSAYEGSPMALLEAAATGLPIVSTDLGGIPEIVLEGRTGFLSEAKNPLLLATQMRRMMNLPSQQRWAMGREGKAYVEAKYGLENIIDRWEDLYREILDRQGYSTLLPKPRSLPSTCAPCLPSRGRTSIHTAPLP